MPAVLAICIVAAQRLDPSMFVGRMPKPNSAVDINNRFILNTVEQFILYFIGNAGLALYCPPQEARTLIVLTALFVLGRVLFWVGYHYNPLCARLRLRHHLLSHRGGLSLAHPEDGIRHRDPALSPAARRLRARASAPAASARTDSSGHRNISTFSVRLSLIMAPTKSSSATAIDHGEPHRQIAPP